MILKFLFVLVCISSLGKAQETVGEYVREILAETGKAYISPTPTSAEQYKPSSNDISDGGDFDFIIVGAGTTGAVLANRLSESQVSVLVLEAGQYGDNFTEIPAMSGISLVNDYNWQYRTTRTGENCRGYQGDTCFYPAGRAVGGTSLINNMIYVRGNKLNFDKWAGTSPEWSYEKVLPYFLKSEDFLKNVEDVVVDKDVHASGGPLHVEYSNFRSFISSYYMGALEEYGLEKTDINRPNNLGYSPMQLTIRNGRRIDTGSAFIKPILDRSNLQVLTKAYVLKVLIDPETKTANGVIYSQNGKLYEARANKEVILSAGAINSPRLLMLSGIGPKDHLESVNIEVIEDLEVGSTFRDHSLITIPVNTNKSIVLKSLDVYVKEYLAGTGPLTIADPSETLAFFQTNSEDSPNLQLNTSPAGENILVPNSLNFAYKFNLLDFPPMISFNPFRSFFLIVAFNIHSKSIGTLRLKSNDPYDYPLINPNILSDQEDVESLLEAMDIVDNLLATDSLKEIDVRNNFDKNVPPRCLLTAPRSRERKICLLRTYAMAGMQPKSSCPMGQNPKDGSVVDQSGKVHNIQKLRVADASIIPLSVSGYTYAICVMLGEYISDMIKNEHNLN